MENENNAAAATDNNAAGAANTGADNGAATAAATAENNQTQSTDNNNGAATTDNTGSGDQGAASQDNSNANQGTANDEVDYSTLVPKVTIDHSGEQIPDPVQDPAGYAEFLNNDQEKRAQFRNTEIRGWQTLEREFPEIKTNAALRQNILAMRLYNAQNGIDKDLIASGRDVMAPYSQAHASGKTDAQVSIETQQGAGLNRTTPANQTTGNSSDLLTDFRRGNVEAGRSLVEQMLKDGKI